MRGCVGHFQGFLPITTFQIMPTLQIAFFSIDAHSTDSLVTYVSANPTQCSIATEGDCTTVTVHISILARSEQRSFLEVSTVIQLGQCWEHFLQL